MDFNFYRLAYNVLHDNLMKFGVSEADIPPPKTDADYPLDHITPGFSRAVVFFQIASRKDLKRFFDEYPRIHNLVDFYTCFESIMSEVLPTPIKVVHLPKDIKKENLHGCTVEYQPKDTTEESISEETTEEYLSEDSKEEDLPEESLSKNNGNQNNSKNSTKENLSKDEDTGNQSQENLIFSSDVPSIIAYSLAVCIEMVLYKYDENKDYIKNLPDLWEKYFNEHLKSIWIKAGCNSNRLKEYTDGIKCPDNFLETFVTENKTEYDDIENNFFVYTEKNYAEDSPDQGRSPVEVEKSPKRLHFCTMKVKFSVLKEVCKCVKSSPTDQTPLLTDYSPCTPSTTPSSPDPSLNIVL